MSYLPHIVCLRGQTWLVVLTGLSDFLTGLAYFMIPTIILVANRKQQLSIDRWLAPIWMVLAVFIFSCGAGHWVDFANLWLARYEFRAVIGWCTTLASWGAVWIFVSHGLRYRRLFRYRQEILEAITRIEEKWPSGAA
jgi:hypothetical protein